MDINNQHMKDINNQHNLQIGLLGLLCLLL